MSFWSSYPQIPRDPNAALRQLAETGDDPVTRAVVNNIFTESQRQKKPKHKSPEANFRCDLCDVTVQSQQTFKDHMEGRSHRQKLKNQELLKQMKQEIRDHPQPKDDDDSNKEILDKVQRPASSSIKCDICDMNLNSPQQLNAHFAGAKHKKMAKKRFATAANESKIVSVPDKPLPSLPPKVIPVQDLPRSIIQIEDLDKKIAGTYKCKSCDCLLNSEHQLHQHLKSQRHEYMELGIPMPQKPNKDDRKFQPYSKKSFKLNSSQTSEAEKWRKNPEVSPHWQRNFVASSSQ